MTRIPVAAVAAGQGLWLGHVSEVPPGTGTAGQVHVVAPDVTVLMPERSAPLLRAHTGLVIAGHTLDSVIATGGMGTIWSAYAPDGTRTAVKVVRDTIARDDAYRARFRREVECLRSAAGPGTLRPLAADVGAEMPYVVTEFVDGPTLKQRVMDTGPLPQDEVERCARDVAVTLRRIHDLGVLHRDLKPGNVILGPDGAVLIDFGIAWTEDAVRLTQPGVVMGSPGWTAPELLMGGHATPASDVFGWGALVAYAAGGRRPFGSGGGFGLAYRIHHEPPDIQQVPERMRDVVRAALAPDPGDRPTTARVLAVLDGVPRPRPWWERGPLTKVRP